MSDTPESIEVQIEGIRRNAAGLSDYDLDVALAVAVARRNVAAAHRMPEVAEVWADLTVALDDVRRMRAAAMRDIAALTAPPEATTRPLTAEELTD